jgi:hypothetical protein
MVAYDYCVSIDYISTLVVKAYIGSKPIDVRRPTDSLHWPDVEGDVTTELREVPMADESKKPKTTPVRLTDEAIRWSRIASGYTGESMSEYVSRVVTEKAREDADRLHAEATRPPAKRPPGKT